MITLGTALAVAGCGGSASPKPSPTSPSPARSSPSQNPSAEIKDGHLAFTVLSLHCGITAVTGTHADAPPNGQFCEAKLRVRNTDQDYHDYIAADQRLEGIAEPDDHPDRAAMGVRRQSDKTTLGGSDLIEVELWYDVPVDAKPVGIRIQGDADPAGYMDSSPVQHSADGIVIPMTPAVEG
jgi:hypothetical protein